MEVTYFFTPETAVSTPVHFTFDPSCFSVIPFVAFAVTICIAVGFGVIIARRGRMDQEDHSEGEDA